MIERYIVTHTVYKLYKAHTLLLDGTCTISSINTANLIAPCHECREVHSAAATNTGKHTAPSPQTQHVSLLWRHSSDTNSISTSLVVPVKVWGCLSPRTLMPIFLVLPSPSMLHYLALQRALGSTKETIERGFFPLLIPLM